MRTLVVSDLHLGTRLGRDVLRRPAARAALLGALEGVDRLVLLGDTVELLEARPRAAMAVAEPVLREIGRRMAGAHEIIVVPGNHDRALVRDWVRAHAAGLATDAEIPHTASPALEQVVSWLGPAPVQVRYPGVWLADGLYATHGHYLDHHLLPVSAYGVARRLVHRPAPEHVTVAAYERSPHVTRFEALLTSYLPRWLGAIVDDVAGELRRAVMSSIPRAARLPAMRRLSPVGALALGIQMRRQALPALVHVIRRLDVDATDVIFGHVHRGGPSAEDAVAHWSGENGAPRVYNTGSWVYEPLLLGRAHPPHPYWPGGAILLEDGAPQYVRLLDAVPAAELRS